MTAVIVKHRITLIWLLLVAATVLSWEVGHGIGISDIRVAGAVILAVAFIKVRLVAFEFMELRHAPWFMRIAADAWIVVILGVLLTLYFLSANS